eukprot:1158743-Pelagomonas_calceolata.AAC.1
MHAATSWHVQGSLPAAVSYRKEGLCSDVGCGNHCAEQEDPHLHKHGWAQRGDKSTWHTSKYVCTSIPKAASQSKHLSAQGVCG